MNAVEVGFAYGRGERITLEDLPSEVSGVEPAAAPLTKEAGAGLPDSLPTFEESERSLLERALETTHGNKVRAAKMLGISRKQLYAKIKKYAIPVASE